MNSLANCTVLTTEHPLAGSAFLVDCFARELGINVAPSVRPGTSTP